jgi:hypothetical protein
MVEHAYSSLASVALLGLALATTGCGASTSDSEDDVNTDASCNSEFSGPIDPSALIDDLEDGDGAIAQVGTRNGGWWITSDGTDGIVTPEADAQPPAERILGKRCESEFGMHITGADFSEWGAVLSLGFRYDGKELPVDLSEFDGVMFWARVGETHSSNVRIQFQDATTHLEGGNCDPEAGSEDECWNGWGTEVSPISSEWQLYKIRFSTLAQRDYGLRSDSFDVENVYNIDFNLDPSSVFDLWIDDLWLFE